MTLRLHSLMERSTVNGPGQRAVIWVQGCSLRCPECWNPQTHNLRQGFQCEVPEIIEWFATLSRENPVEGITISGGEPMEQGPAVLELLRRLKAAHPTLSLGLFSGYSEGELSGGVWIAIRDHLDFAVLGRYSPRRPSTSAMISSTNQALHLYTSRYSMADFAEQSVEVHINDAGLTQITGFPLLGSPVLD
jgi:anaerobic ribonucleoside-triphosphate reductase activating protein